MVNNGYMILGSNGYWRQRNDKLLELIHNNTTMEPSTNPESQSVVLCQWCWSLLIIAFPVPWTAPPYQSPWAITQPSKTKEQPSNLSTINSTTNHQTCQPSAIIKRHRPSTLTSDQPQRLSLASNSGSFSASPPSSSDSSFVSPSSASAVGYSCRLQFGCELQLFLIVRLLVLVLVGDTSYSC